MSRNRRKLWFGLIGLLLLVWCFSPRLREAAFLAFERIWERVSKQGTQSKWIQRLDSHRRKKAEADLGVLQVQLEMYRVIAGEYPTTAQGLDALVSTPTIPPYPRGWKPLLNSVPVDPWGRPYVYTKGVANCELRSHGWNATDASDDLVKVFPAK